MGSRNINDYNQSLTPEERAERARIAGVRSGEVRRQHRAMREVLKLLMTLDTTNADMRHLLEQLGLEPTNDNAVSLAQIVNACKGDTESARFVRDTLGEKPTENYNLGVAGKPIQALDLSGLSDEELEALADQAGG